MSEKVNLYVKFIRNEQKRLSSSTVVAPRMLREAQTRPEAGAPGPAPGGRASGSGLGSMPPQAYVKPKKFVAEPKPPSAYEAGLRRLGLDKEKAKPAEPTVSPSAAQAQPAPKMAPRAEFKTEPLQVKTAVAGAAGAVGGAAAIKAGMDTTKEVEAERTVAQKAAPTPTPAAKPAEKAKPVEPKQPEPSQQQTDDEESEKYVSDIERKAQKMKKEAVEKLFSIKKPRI